MGVPSTLKIRVAASAAAFAGAVVAGGPLAAQTTAPPVDARGAPSGQVGQVGQATAERAPVRREVASKSKKAKPATEAKAPTVPAAPAASAATGAAGAAASTSTSTSTGSVPAAATAAAPPPPDVWSEAEIKEAKAYCQKLLTGVDAVYVEEDPIKQGACGSPVVYKVTNIGKGPGVELSPPVTMTCDMIASLEKWMKRDVQPKARAMLGASVIKIETMSSYSCRNAYGRTLTKLSEHGRANAIDIAGFSTGKDTAMVLADWGPTIREQKIIAAKQEAERAAAAAAAASAAATANNRNAISTGSLPNVLPGTISPMPGTGRIAPPTGMGLAPSRLGGPKDAPASGSTAATNAKTAAAPPAGPPAPSGPPPAKDAPTSGKRAFLHEIHASACKHFGTVLGPEANNAHRNHFHLDMAPRRLNNFCE